VAEQLLVSEIGKIFTLDGQANDWLCCPHLNHDATILIASALGDDDRGNHSGAVYLFEPRSTVGGEVSWGRWTMRKFAPDDLGDEDFFGWDAEINGDFLVVGTNPLAQSDDVASGGSAVC